MKRALAICLLSMVGATGALADRYADCRQADDIERSIKACSEIVERSVRETVRNRADAHAWRGSGYMLKRDYDRAIADYDSSIALDPKSPRTAGSHNGRGVAFLDKGDFDRAIADFDSAIALDPRSATAYSNRAIAYSRKGTNTTSYRSAGGSPKGDYERAIADYDKALALDANNAALHIGRGNAYLETANYDRAIADFDRAIALNASSAPVFRMRGEAHDRKGDAARATADYESATKLELAETGGRLPAAPPK